MRTTTRRKRMLRDFFTNDEEPTAVDDLIESVLKEMNEYGPSEPEYTPLMEKLERLYALKLDNKPKPVSRDTVIMGAVHLFGILIIVLAEKQHVLSSKAMSQIGRALK